MDPLTHVLKKRKGHRDIKEDVKRQRLGDAATSHRSWKRQGSRRAFEGSAAL